MAVNKANRSVHPKQPTRSTPRTRKLAPFRKLVHFPQVKGRTIEDVEFSTAPGYHNISVNFQDKTALNFSIETGFTVETDYSNWKTGNQQILHRWPPFKNKK